MSAGEVGDPATMPDFPPLEARSLNGRTYRLSGDLEGELNVLLVGFEWWQQELIDSWVPFLEELASRRTDLRIYELFVIPRSYLPARPFIDGGMVRGIPEDVVRARTLTAYTDLPRALACLGLKDTRDVALFLVERTGRVCWRARGSHDPEGADALARALSYRPPAENLPRNRQGGPERQRTR